MKQTILTRFLPGLLPSRKTRFFLYGLLLVSCLAVFPACNPYPAFEFSISHYDPAQAYNGVTYFQSHVNNSAFFSLNMDGDLLWEYKFENLFGMGFNLTHDGNVLGMINDAPIIIDPATSEVLWEANQRMKGHHSIFETPWGTFMFLRNEGIQLENEQWGTCLIDADWIAEVDINSETVWEWHIIDYVDPVEHHPEGLCEVAPPNYSDWTHCNTIKLIQDYTYDGITHEFVILLLSRELDTFYMIDYPSGDIIWSCGQHGDFGRIEPPDEPLFKSAHEIDLLDNGNFVLFDNGAYREVRVSRALEIAVDPVAGTTAEVWSWTDPDQTLYNPWGGDADRLPNGNTLVTDVIGLAAGSGRIIEVNPAGDKVWEMEIQTLDPSPGAYSVYQFKRVPY